MNGLPSRFRWSGSLFYANRVLLIGAYLLSEGTFVRFAAGATLEQLFSGGVINVGNSQFSEWELISLDSTAAVNPDLSQIVVVPLVNDPSNPGLQFAANGQLSISGVNSIDLAFKFRVTTLAGGKAFTNHALALSGIDFGSNGGLANISVEVTASSGADLGSTLVIADKGSEFIQSLDSSDFAPQPEVFLVTNVFISGLSDADAINLASFTQTFSQTGPAVTPFTADFDEDGDVDAADLAKWKLGFGVKLDATHMQGDADGDADVDGADFLTWQRQLGSATTATATAAVPEPATLFLLVLGALAILLRLRAGVS